MQISLEDRILAEATRLNCLRPDYKHFEHIAHVVVVRIMRAPLTLDASCLNLHDLTAHTAAHTSHSHHMIAL